MALGYGGGAFKKPPESRLELIGIFANGFGKAFPDSLPSFEKNYVLLDSVAPFWASVNPVGEVAQYGFRHDAFKSFRDKGIPINLLIVAEAAAGDKSVVVKANVGRVVDGIAAVADSKQYDGVILSFENLSREAGPDFLLLVDKVAHWARPRGVSLGVMLRPGQEAIPEFAYALRFVDYFILMTADKHNLDTAPGPVAPLDWVRSAIQGALRIVPPGKLYLMVGAYGYDWPQDPKLGKAEYLTTHEAVARAKLYNARIERKPWEGVHYSYLIRGVERDVWFEDASTIVSKLQLAEQMRLRGVVLWRLGYEDDLFWRDVAKRVVFQ